MTKYYCDCCGKELKQEEKYDLYVDPPRSKEFKRILCKGCVERFIYSIFATELET